MSHHAPRMPAPARQPAFRPEDHALLERLLDEQLLERVYRDLAPSAALPHPRAAGVLACLRRTDPGRHALREAEDGRLAPLVRALTEPDPARTEPELAHHLAILLSGLADRLEKDARAVHLRTRSLALWLRLASQQSYLRSLASAVVGAALRADRAAHAADAIALEEIDALGERAREGAGDLTPASAMILAALARAPEAAALAGSDDKLAQSAAARAGRARASAIDVAIGRLEHALDEARLRSASGRELAGLMEQGAAVWRWAGKDEQVEHFLIEKSTPFCWDLYRDRKWDELRAVLKPMDPAMQSLASRIERDKSKLAYAAPCAQYFVFLAELAPTLDRQLLLCERAVALCPTHRNGRLVLADILVVRALHALDGALPWGDGVDNAERDVRRAQELFPMLDRLPEAKRRLQAHGRRVDG